MITKPDAGVFYNAIRFPKNEECLDKDGKYSSDISMEKTLKISKEDPPLTKREYFAAMAMTGLLPKYGSIDGIALMAVYQADGLIKELNRGETNGQT